MRTHAEVIPETRAQAQEEKCHVGHCLMDLPSVENGTHPRPARARAAICGWKAGARLCLVWVLAMLPSAFAADRALVLQSDFGLRDGAVAAMRGIAFGVSQRLALHDLSHDNAPFDIWEAAYRLKQAAPFWPAGTVFVSVIDPGVGTERAAIVVETKSGHFFVAPDNGTLTFVAEELGVAAVRRIDESVHRRPGSDRSYTFHGRDLFAYVGARLAAGVVRFADVGPLLEKPAVMLAYERPRREGAALVGAVPVLDIQYGNVWTNIDEGLFATLTPRFGDRFRVEIAREGKVVFSGELRYAATFADVPKSAPLMYLNSLMNVSFALNVGNFANTHGIGSGPGWTVRVEKAQP